MSSGDLERAEVASQVASTFIEEHLALFAEPILPRLEHFGPDDLITAGRMLLELTGPAPRSGYPLSAAFDVEDDSSEMAAAPPPRTATLIQIEP